MSQHYRSVLSTTPSLISNFVPMTTPKILPALEYNKFFLDHDATCKAEALNLKSSHAANLINIIKACGLEAELEVHVLHRHFELEGGEALVHKEIHLETDPRVVIDVAKAIKCPCDSATQLTPVMWYFTKDRKMVPYEYTVRMNSKYPTGRVADTVPCEKLQAFASEFSNYVCENGLQDVVSLKDKSCVMGLEFVAYESRALFKVPASLVNLQGSRHLVETGWTLDEDAPLIMTDSHVTKTRQTTGGTVAVYHATVTSNGVDAFDPKEVSPAYTEKMWAAVEAGTFDSWCAVAG